MQIDLSRLYNTKEIPFDYEIEIPEMYYKKLGINSISKIRSIGKVYENSAEEVILECSAKGTLYLEDAYTLDNVPKEIDLNIEEVINDNNDDLGISFDKTKNTLDLIEVLWENIVLEVPISITNDAKHKSLSGDGWCLTDKQIKKDDPRLEPLKALLDKKGKE